MNIQKIFDTAIARGFYGPESSRFMCNSVKNMFRNGVISGRDMEDALTTIKVYINSIQHNQTLIGHLIDVYSDKGFELADELTDDQQDELCKKIYQNWNRRFEIQSEGL